MRSLCAGNGNSRSGFSSDLPTLGIPGNPLMNLLLVQTGWRGVCMFMEEKKYYCVALIVELWSHSSTLDLQKDIFLKLPF